MTRKAKKTFGAEYLFAALFLIIAAVVIGWQLNRSVVVTGISVTGNRISDAGDILQASGMEAGLHADSIAFLGVIERIETLPWVASAFVSLSQSGHLRIRVEEEEPIALLVDGRRSALVTGSGIQLPVVLGKSMDVPILHGFPVVNSTSSVHHTLAGSETGSGTGTGTGTGTVSRTGSVIVPDTLKSPLFDIARDFLAEVRQFPGLYAMVSEIMVTEDDGVVALSNENAVRLTFGHGDFEDRIRKWQAFQSQVVSEKGIRHVRSLDFRFRGQVVARE